MLLLDTGFLAFFGRLHPMIIHFPIALLIVGFLMEMLSLQGKRAGLRPGADWLVYAGTVSALLAVGMGLALQESEQYSGELVLFHKRTGILTLILAVVAAALLWRANRRQSSRRFYHISLGLTLIVLTVCGHLGASLTHGEDYLSGAFPAHQEERDSGHASHALAEFTALQRMGSLSPHQLDRLNLEVRAIFAHKCFQCHSREKHKGELVLQTQAGVMAGGENGPILKSGDAAHSEIIRRLQLPRRHDDAMPPKGEALNTAEINLIRLWIDQGAHWADKTLKIFREAPLALTTPELPPIEKGLSHPVDRIVNHYFQQQGQAWPDLVDDRTFARRLWLDAIGLLPEPAQLQAFLADDSPEKRTKLVDQLLADTLNYTQHWLSFWNDLLRNDYSGTGFITGGRKRISPWLYQALWENKSYDQMVRELINPTEESEGFIKGIRWRGVVNASQRTEMQAAQNISQSLLGLNLKCASCHDSFVSNLTLDQAYSFANIFADSALEIHRCDKPTGRMAQTKFIYPVLGKVQAETVAARLEQLSEIMVKPENGRLYRTIVNRLWARLMGRGMVAPVDEMDRLPWSQDLLDWLASDFVTQGTDLKHALRRVFTSRTYQLPSVGNESAQALRSESFRFRGPIRRRLSAEQFADAISQSMYPLYHAVAFDPGGEELEAQWIWHREIEADRDVLPKPGKRYFRYVFELPKAKAWTQAQLLVTADHSFTLYLNEQEVARDSNWWQVEKVEVSHLLKPGKNVFALIGENEGDIPNPAGLLLSLQVNFVDSTHLRIHSERNWKSLDTLPQGNWLALEYADDDWPKVRRFAGFFNTKWGRLPQFTHQPAPGLDRVRASLVALDPFLKALGRPTRENVATAREDRANLLQALEFSNGSFFHTSLQAAARHWISQSAGDQNALIRTLYQRCLGREPNAGEWQSARKLMGEELDQEGVEDFLWAILMLPEFQLIY